jgi:hypothetical protein
MRFRTLELNSRAPLGHQTNPVGPSQVGNVVAPGTGGVDHNLS